MTIPEWLLTVFFSIGCLYWLAMLVFSLRLVRRVPVLSAVAVSEPARLPRLSVLIPACNEADTLEEAMQSRLSENYPDIEFILVNDRSTDATGRIIDDLAASNPRIRALHIDKLPSGWLGKVNALQTAVSHATGEWLLFIDADVHLAPGTLRRAVAWCLQRDREHLAVFPEFWSSTFVLDAVMASFLRLGCVGARAWAVEDERSSASVGVGAFNLVRRDALARTPGLEWLRLEVVDDVALGQMLKQHGVRTSVANGRGMVQLHWYRNVPEMARGAEKNAFAALGRFSYARLLAFSAAYSLLELSPLITLACSALSFPATVSMVAIVLGLTGLIAALAAIATLCRWLRRPVLPGLLFPIGACVFTFVMLRSAYLAWRRGGLLWRGTLYPLEQLRAGARFRFI